MNRLWNFWLKENVESYTCSKFYYGLDESKGMDLDWKVKNQRIKQSNVQTLLYQARAVVSTVSLQLFDMRYNTYAKLKSPFAMCIHKCLECCSCETACIWNMRQSRFVRNTRIWSQIMWKEFYFLTAGNECKTARFPSHFCRGR